MLTLLFISICGVSYVINAKPVVNAVEEEDVKTTKEEILKGAKLLAERLNTYESPVIVLIPLRGFRTFTQKGEALYDPEVDQALIDYLHQHLKQEICIVEVDANANDETFSQAAADEMERLMRNWSGQK